MPRITFRMIVSASAALAICCCSLVWAEEPIAARPAGSEALAKYVGTDDPAFEWKVRRTTKLGPTEATEVILTSQKWQGITWRHQLYLLKPASWDGKASHGMLFIAGGSWQDKYAEPPTGDESLPNEARVLAAVAERIGTPLAVLRQVPNQPLFDGKHEDAIIALTFKRYLETGDDTWPLLLPMTKSAVRAMDATQAFAKEHWSAELNTFTVTGASKRGWTTWLTGATDARATAIAPMVIDMLNMPRQMEHQVKAWGDFSYKIDDYTKLNLPEQLKTPGGKKLQQIVDPFSYRQGLTQPKLILLGTNDHYWPLDAANLYWNELAGPKHLLYLPNNRHSLSDYGRLIGTMAALHRSMNGGDPLPKLDWKFDPTKTGLTLSVFGQPAPKSVSIWRASSKTRDFRASEWTSVEAEIEGDAHVFHLANPPTGYEAFFGEAVYGEGDERFHLSTNVRIVEPVE